jgi:ABC-type multidrug transport system fused ATPase/permease subunit
MKQFNSIATQLIALSISTVVILVVMLGPVSESGDSGVAGIALTYAFLLPYFFGLASDLMMAFFSLLPSLERLFEYLPGADLPSEAPRILPADAALQQKDGKRWPSAGALAFQDVEMRYRPGLPRALKGMSVHLQGGTKVGIVGRTGAGKSSLLVALFRLTEIEAGTISIDGQVLAEMGLKVT